METNFVCGSCGRKGIIITAMAIGGWKVTCSNAHEVMPIPVTIIVVKEKRESIPGIVV